MLNGHEGKEVMKVEMKMVEEFGAGKEFRWDITGCEVV